MRKHPTALHVEFNREDGKVIATYGWAGPSIPRTPAPPMPAELLPVADRMARAALSAEPGQLQRSQEGVRFIYRLVGESDPDRV